MRRRHPYRFMDSVAYRRVVYWIPAFAGKTAKSKKITHYELRSSCVLSGWDAFPRRAWEREEIQPANYGKSVEELTYVRKCI